MPSSKNSMYDVSAGTSIAPPKSPANMAVTMIGNSQAMTFESQFVVYGPALMGRGSA
jgi:hypothetical protein